jgi:hypothetical protein
VLVVIINASGRIVSSKVNEIPVDSCEEMCCYNVTYISANVGYSVTKNRHVIWQSNGKKNVVNKHFS